ncbi:MAG: AAA family ATPase [Chloroflexi bacterium]|nr:AAA family ATPase [Chloroflexota bacterium]
MSTAIKAPPAHDELDHRIDDILDRMGMFLFFWARILIVFGSIGTLAWLIFFSPWSNVIREPFMFAMLMLFQIMFAIVFVIIQFAAIFWFLGRSRVYWIMPGETGLSFEDYRGNPDILEVARRIVTLLRGVKHFRDMGGEVHRGLLLIGPPGTGKSYLAQCIATEAGVPFCYASAPSFTSMFFGISNLKVMMLYGKARKLARRFGACIVFVDEIDAIGASRSGGGAGMGGGMFGGMMGGGSGLLNELLMQMDPPRIDDTRKNRMLRAMGLRARGAERPAVLTMGATNIPQVLDQALLRPGRFDWKIQIDAPDFDGRKEVLEYYLDKVAHDPNLPVDRIAHETTGYSPASIKYIVNEAVVVAHFDGRDLMEYKDFVMAREMYEWGIRQPIKSMSEEERRRIAVHETGHAVAQVKLLPKEQLVQVTIVRHGQALGITGSKPNEEVYGYSVEELMAQIQVFLAGKAAEQVFLGTEFTGAGSDLQQATRIAGAIIGHYGMNGSLYATGALGEGPDPRMRREIERILEDEFKKVKHLLLEYRESSDEIVRRLLERDDLLGDEVMEIIAAQDRERAARLDGGGNGHYLPEASANGHSNGHAAPAPTGEIPARIDPAVEGQQRETDIGPSQPEADPEPPR